MWRPPVEPSPAEQAVIKAVRRAKLFVFLRLHRHELFDEEFQGELAQRMSRVPLNFGGGPRDHHAAF
jgi:hypothetical protein